MVALVAALGGVPATGVGAADDEGAGFLDMHTSPHAGYIEAIAAAGITTGCAPERYCPQDGVTRGQMSAFLVRAFDLPSAPDAGFTDTAGTLFQAEIDAVAGAGIAGGFADGTFRPGMVVSRAQMASFLTAALGLPPGDHAFSDVPAGHTHEVGIGAVTAAGIAGGFSDGTFRPAGPVTREQMATFLGRALGLEPIVIDYPAPPEPDDGPAAVVADLLLRAVETHAFTLGRDVWQVWVCRVPTDTVDPLVFHTERVSVDVEAATTLLRSELRPFFAWLSEGAHDLRFEVGGSFTVGSDDPSALESCQFEAMFRAAGADGVFVITDLPTSAGLGTIGPLLPEPFGSTVLPDSHRRVMIGAYGVLPDPTWSQPPALAIAAHEIGHALGFPHSFHQGTFDEYTDAIDVMGGAPSLLGVDRLTSTIAVNRFAAGWMGDRGRVHPGGTREYTVGSVGYGGTQLVVVPSGDPLAFTAIGAVTRRGHDTVQPTEGVTLHRVDQRPETCFAGFFDQDCALDQRRHAPIGTLGTTDHVLAPGQSRDLGGVTITVLERVGDGFRIRVGGDRADFPPITRD